MSLSSAEVEHVARLARLRLNAEELEQMRGQLSDILDYIAMLQEVDVTGVPATSQVTGLVSVTRPDAVTGKLTTEQALANAPDTQDGMFRVRAVFEE
ncbi:Asp-tRNA(Asn)/Glu-tRNA(Gln) amidotransferase subunit GatC [Oscillochloris sp. ZM17-4]|uniref:Asp-tRNA(Asn)/Glu-tRNA(Gln) amidotransferase subunit GatC n=1 Tax=Oscillochloris sp. ZM17-4 TaxID=2866714 RepID=UPI001C72A807|nr:Asp-tRNA(Asn)/Glu-tRNA(Gln) amidotransferase subunit GatC [Oscillochloris sp. ZM17-4]MBX0330444.1 Asp-tRNA(Asn)/Glu-tRNA(Gln) amidotransferase subunit GatC [Oscillochloris sp. ZM17-4]